MTTEGEPPAAELLWGERPRPSRGPKPSLSLDRIVREAIDLADHHGLGALSMQKLAGRLGVGTMSLYRYVPGKDELVSLMIDTALDDPAGAPAGEHWRTGLERWARDVRALFLRHPWMLPLVTRPRLMGPCETSWLEAALRAVSGSGLPPAAMFEVVLLVNGHVRASAAPYVDEQTREAAGQAGATQARMVFDQQDRYPTLAAVLGAGVFDEPDEGQSSFEFGLARILDGVERYLAER